MIATTKLKVSMVSEMMTNSAKSSGSDSPAPSHRSSSAPQPAMSKGASLHRRKSKSTWRFRPPSIFEFAVAVLTAKRSGPVPPTEKKQVHWALISLVILSGFTGIGSVQKRDEVLFFLRGLVPDVADQCGIIEAFCFDPEIFRRFFSLRPSCS